MKRVLYVIPGGTFGGAHNQVLRLAPALRGAGYEPVVLLPDDEGNARVRLVEAGIETVTEDLVRVRASADWRVQAHFVRRAPFQVRRLGRLMRLLRADLVQAHGITQVDVALAARRAGLPLVWQLLDTRSPAALNLAGAPFLRRLPDVIMTTGRATLAHHLDPASVRAPVVEYVPPVRPDLRVRPDASAARTRARLGVASDDVLTVSVGNLNPQKSHETLIEAFTAVAGPGRALRIRGAVSPSHAAYTAALRDRVQSRGMTSSVIGAMEPGIDVPDLLAAADVFCLASAARSEGMPTVILEAMASGLPVVASDVGAVSETVLDGHNGYTFTSGDCAALSRALERLLSSPALRAEMGAASRALYEERFTIELCVEANLHALDLAARGRTRRGTPRPSAGS